MSQEQQKRCHVYDLIRIFSNFGSISPIFGQILKCSMVTKWHQLESISRYANESGIAKKIATIRDFHLHLPVNSTLSIFDQK